MIIRYNKVFTFFLLVSLSCVVYGEKIAPPISMEELPTNIEEQSPKELATLMAHISSWSYQALLEVPQKGLKAQKEKLEQIIALRKWLQARQHPLFQLLAFKLTIAVNNILLDELFRKEMARQGTKIGSYDFKADSLDDKLVKHLLSLNTVDEQAIIESVINFEGKIATYCRQQNYSMDKYLNGSVFEQFSEEIGNYTDKWRDILISPIFLVKFSRPFVSDLLFVQALELIDKQRDTRMLTDIYFESGFPENTRELVELKLSKTKKIRLATNYKTHAHEVMNTLFYRYYSPLPYEQRKTMFFLPFLDTLDVVPSKYSMKFSRKLKRCKGLWLTFAEGMEQDEGKMSQEDKDRIRYCSILKTPSEIMQ